MKEITLEHMTHHFHPPGCYLHGELKYSAATPRSGFLVIDEAKGAGEGLTECTVVHTRKESNGVAHELAQLAKRNRHSAVWRFVAPACVEQLVAQFSSQKKKMKVLME